MKSYDRISEQVLLSSILSSGDNDKDSGLVDEVMCEIAETDFGSVERQKIYLGMAKLRSKALRVDTVSLMREFIDDNDVLNELHAISTMRTTTNTDSLIDNISSFTAVRGLTGQIQQFSEAVQANNVDATEAVEGFVDEVNKVNLRQKVKQNYTAEHLASTFFSELQERMSRKESVVGLRSGFAELDNASGGFRGGDLITIGALPGMGKTSLAISIIAKMVIDGLSPALFTFEMSKLQTQSNIISAVSCIDEKYSTVPRSWIERPLINNEGWLMTSSKIMSSYVESKGFYADRSIAKRSIATIRSNCFKLKAEGRLDAIFVDHIGLMIEDFNKERAEIANITGSLKKVAGELDVPVFQLSQMNVRDIKHVDRPVMGMLKGSSTIEADSDTILFPWRPYAINKEGDPTEAMLFIGKSRSFSGNDIELEFVEDAVCFREKEVTSF